MASDEIVWQIINQQFCSFKIKTTKSSTFCRNTYNATGLCNRQSCPLANSRYATIRSSPETGALYLCLKVPERSHLPSKLWERHRLPSNYASALALIDSKLQFWPKFLIHKCKQRLTRLTQVAIRARKIGQEEERLGERVVPKLAPKVRRREDGRERKALGAAKVERAIERELLGRLKSGAYGDRPLNVEEGVWKRVLRGLEREGEGERDVDVDEGIEDEEEEIEGEEELEGEVEYVSGDEEEEDEDEIGDLEEWLGEQSAESDLTGESEEDDDSESEKENFKEIGGKRKRVERKGPISRKKGPKVEIEYEQEIEAPLREAALAK